MQIMFQHSTKPQPTPPLPLPGRRQHRWKFPLAVLFGLLTLAGGAVAQETVAQETATQPPSHGASDPEGAHDHHGGTHDHHGGAHDHGKEAKDGAEPYTSHDLRHDFSDAERWAAIFDAPERLEWQRPGELVQLMAISDGQTVADLGAGTGFLLPFLAAATPHGKVLALDPEANLVEHMRRRSDEAGLKQVEVRQIPYDDPQLADGSVDRLVIVNTWHHIQDREQYASKILAGLNVGGELFVVDFTLDSPSGPPKEHRLPPQQVIEELKAGGFDAELIEEPLPRQYIVVGRRPN